MLVPDRVCFSPLAVAMVCGVVFCAAARIEAQTPPTLAPGWTLGFNLQQTWQSNPTYSLAGQGDFVSLGRAFLTRNWSSADTVVSLSGQGSGELYHQYSYLDGFNYAGDLKGSHQFSERFDVVADAGVIRSYTRENQLLTGSGLLLPLAIAISTRAQLRPTYKLSSSTSFSANAVYDRFSFDQVSTPNAASLINGSSTTLGADLIRQLGREQSASGFYGWERTTDTLGDIGTFQTIGARWKFVGRSTSANASLGMTHFDTSGTRTSSGWTPAVLVGLQGRLSGTAFDLTYNRALSPA